MYCMSVDIARNDFFLTLKGLLDVSVHTRTDALALSVFDASVSTGCDRKQITIPHNFSRFLSQLNSLFQLRKWKGSS